MMLKTFQEMGLNPKGDNLTELDQQIKDISKDELQDVKSNVSHYVYQQKNKYNQNKFNDIITVFFKCQKLFWW